MEDDFPFGRTPRSSTSIVGKRVPDFVQNQRLLLVCSGCVLPLKRESHEMEAPFKGKWLGNPAQLLCGSVWVSPVCPIIFEARYPPDWLALKKIRRETDHARVPQKRHTNSKNPERTELYTQKEFGMGSFRGLTCLTPFRSEVGEVTAFLEVDIWSGHLATWKSNNERVPERLFYPYQWLPQRFAANFSTAQRNDTYKYHRLPKLVPYLTGCSN